MGRPQPRRRRCRADADSPPQTHSNTLPPSPPSSISPQLLNNHIVPDSTLPRAALQKLKANAFLATRAGLKLKVGREGICAYSAGTLWLEGATLTPRPRPRPPQVASPKAGLLISVQGARGFLPAARLLNETTVGFGMVQIIDQLLLPASLEPPPPKPKPSPPPPRAPKRKGMIGGGLATDVLVSQGKTAYASSVYMSNSAYGANVANDGNLGNLFHSSCNLDGSGPWCVGAAVACWELCGVL